MRKFRVSGRYEVYINEKRWGPKSELAIWGIENAWHLLAILPAFAIRRRWLRYPVLALLIFGGVWHYLEANGIVTVTYGK